MTVSTIVAVGLCLSLIVVGRNETVKLLDFLVAPFCSE
jgi:hypothetical protein